MRLLASAACLLLGLVAATGAVLLHQMVWGLALGIVVGALLWWSLPPRWGYRLAYGAGWVVVAVLAAAPRGSGDYLVPANLFGYAFLVWSTALAVAGLLSTGPRRAADPEVSGRST